jgi:hypothetical protein
MSSAALSGCACIDAAGGGLGVLLIREKVAGEAGALETRRRGPEASDGGEVVKEGARG